MSIHQTFFQPTAVVRTDKVTGDRTLEIDFTGSMIRNNDWYPMDPEQSESDMAWLDEVIGSKSGYFENTEPGIIRVHSTDFVS